MQAVRQRDTSPELALRSMLHRAGLRFRVCCAPVPGRRKADIVFGPARVAVYLDGCFWHGCPRHATWPKANAAYWRQKIRRRDADTDELLARAGWRSIRVWEHENALEAATRVDGIVRRRRQKLTT